MARINAYLVTGGWWHDFDFARLELLKLLGEDDHIRVQVAQNYDDIEAISACDFLVSYTCNVRPSTDVQHALRAWVTGGGRWFALHGTNSAIDPPTGGLGKGSFETPRAFPAFAETLGSQFLSHPPIEPYEVTISPGAEGDPLVTGIEPFDADDELYLCEYHGNIEPLLETHWHGNTGPGFAEAEWPNDDARLVMYRRPLGEGCVLYFTLGHCRSHYDMIAPPFNGMYWPTIERGAWELTEFYELLRRGIVWAKQPAVTPRGKRALMLAGLVTGQRLFELVDVPEPEPRPGTAVVHITRCGICGTDLHGFLSADPYNPAICGHEWVGVVTTVGSGVDGAVEGERVVAGIAPPCGSCPECAAGRPAYCVGAFLGMIGRDPLAPPHGGFAPRISVDAKRLIQVPGALSDDEAAMVEPTTVALHAVLRTPPRPDDTVIVQGCGPIGLLTLQCVRALGAGRVVAIEPNEHRRHLAAACGADAVMTPDEAFAEFSRRGADLVFECAGIAATVQRAIDLVRRGGIVNLVGLASGTAEVSPGTWLIKEATVLGSLGYIHHEFAQAMDLMADRHVQVLPLHDRTVSLTELPVAMADLADDPSSATKVLVDPHG